MTKKRVISSPVYGDVDAEPEAADRYEKAMRELRAERDPQLDPYGRDMRKGKARIMPEPEIKRPALPKEARGLDVENVVDVPEETLRKVVARTKRATALISEAMLFHDIPVLLAHDNATSYVEVALRDGLGIDVEIDDDVLKAVAHLNHLSLIYQYSLLLKLPRSVRKLYLEEITRLLAKESVDDMKKSVTGRKYSQKLRELAGVVRTRSEKDDETVNLADRRPPKGKK